MRVTSKIPSLRMASRLASTLLLAGLTAATSAVAQGTTPAPQTPAQTAPQPPAQTPVQTAPQPAPQTPAQTTPATPDAQQPNGKVFTLPGLETNEVNLIFTVTDKHGHFITGLQQQNFGLLDDGRPPISVLQFTQQTNLPLRVGVLLDTSSSIRQRFQFEQDSAIEFFLQVLHF